MLYKFTPVARNVWTGRGQFSLKALFSQNPSTSSVPSSGTSQNASSTTSNAINNSAPRKRISLHKGALKGQKVMDQKDIARILQQRFTVLGGGAAASTKSADSNFVKCVSENKAQPINNPAFPFFEVRHHFQQKASCVFSGVERWNERALAISQSLSREHDLCPVHCNAYFSPDDAPPAFHYHYDPWDVVVLQMEGRKKWEIAGHPFVLHSNSTELKTDRAISYDQILENADVLGLPVGPGGSASSSNKLANAFITEVILEPGDVLFIPNRFPHRAMTVGAHDFNKNEGNAILHTVPKNGALNSRRGINTSGLPESMFHLVVDDNKLRSSRDAEWEDLELELGSRSKGRYSDTHTIYGPSLHLTYGVENESHTYPQLVYQLAATQIFKDFDPVVAVAPGEGPSSASQKTKTEDIAASLKVPGMGELPAKESFERAFFPVMLAGRKPTEVGSLETPVPRTGLRLYSKIPKPAFDGDWNAECDQWVEECLLKHLRKDAEKARELTAAAATSAMKDQVLDKNDAILAAAGIGRGSSGGSQQPMVGISAYCHDGQTRDANLPSIATVLDQAITCVSSDQSKTVATAFANLSYKQCSDWSSRAEYGDIDFFEFDFMTNTNPWFQTTGDGPYYLHTDPKTPNKSYMIARGQRVAIPTPELAEAIKFVVGKYTGSKGLPFQARDAPNLDAVGFCLSMGIIKHLKTPHEIQVGQAEGEIRRGLACSAGGIL